MIIQRNFNRRAEDINEIFSLIDFIAGIEPHKNIPLVSSANGAELHITQEMQCALKAQFLILLYNLVESTVCDCLNTIYDSIADEELTFGELSREIKAMWRNYLRRTSHPDFIKTDAELAGTPVMFESLAINISGSLDLRKINEVFAKHGCTLDQTNRDKYSNSFLAVKNKRNLLAHGNTSFSECGSNYMISDLHKFKDEILNGMQEIVAKVREYIDNRKYKQ